jgi:hypothetical protein
MVCAGIKKRNQRRALMMEQMNNNQNQMPQEVIVTSTTQNGAYAYGQPGYQAPQPDMQQMSGQQVAYGQPPQVYDQ